MFLTIIILPLLSSILSGFFGRKIGVKGSRYLSCLIILTMTILAIISYLEVGFTNNPVTISLFKWLESESFNIGWDFQFDSLTVSMLIPVLVISTLVHFYSIGYMSHDPHNQRFFSYLSLFTFMMVILVTGNNYLVMFVGWEGVGVCSYLLVSFWFTRIAANQSSISAFLTNRVGDCFLTLGMFSVLWSIGNLDYNLIFSLTPYLNENLVTIIGICFLIGAMAKSSQVGLHIWLPMAMEGPTPVSALIHAATMVTAGVYLLIRSSPLIEYSSTVLLICLWLGAVTTVFSSLIGLFQQDIKKIIAYSTMSQLGMMVIAIGLSSYNIAIFHLMNHAFYKGLLFLGAGAVIHAVVDNQDLRKYGGLRSFLPLTYTVILIASLSLVAFPFMTGFFSKDFILESAYGQYEFSSINIYVIAVTGAIFTTLYSVKVLYLTFLTNPNGPINYFKNAHEGDIFLSLPLIILAIFSVYFGFITKDIYIGLGSGFFIDNSIFIHPLHEILIDTEFGVPTIFKLIPFIFTLIFSGLGLIYSEFIPTIISNFKLSNLGYYIFGFFNQRFLIEFFYNKFIVNKILFMGGQTTKILDRGSLEWIGPYGLGVVLNKISKTISSLNNGVVTDYALYILMGLCFYLFLFTFTSLVFDLMSFTLMISIYVTLSSGLVNKEDLSFNRKNLTIKKILRKMKKYRKRIVRKVKESIKRYMASIGDIFDRFIWYIVLKLKFKIHPGNVPILIFWVIYVGARLYIVIVEGYLGNLSDYSDGSDAWSNSVSRSESGPGSDMDTLDILGAPLMYDNRFGLRDPWEPTIGIFQLAERAFDYYAAVIQSHWDIHGPWTYYHNYRMGEGSSLMNSLGNRHANPDWYRHYTPQKERDTDCWLHYYSAPKGYGSWVNFRARENAWPITPDLDRDPANFTRDNLGILRRISLLDRNNPSSFTSSDDDPSTQPERYSAPRVRRSTSCPPRTHPVPSSEENHTAMDRYWQNRRNSTG